MYICKKCADEIELDLEGYEPEPKASTCYVCNTYTGVYKVRAMKVYTRMNIPRYNDTVEVNHEK